MQTYVKAHLKIKEIQRVSCIYSMGTDADLKKEILKKLAAILMTIPNEFIY